MCIYVVIYIHAKGNKTENVLRWFAKKDPEDMINLLFFSARLIFWQILENYVSKFVEKKVPEPWTPRQKDYFQKSVAGFMHPIVNYNPNSTRVKRQSDLRIRREIRMLSIDQRRRYFTAVNEMKRDRVSTFLHRNHAL